VSISTGVVAVAAITTGVVVYLRQHPGKKVAVVPVIGPRATGAVVVIKM
jgi:hypothetical protein